MKKVALLTYHDTTNFGAMLQMYGLYRKVNDLGYHCSILNYCNENICRFEIPPSFHFSLNPKALVIELLVKSRNRKKYRDMVSFFNKNIDNVTARYSRDGLFHISEKFDTFVAGSDMLWALDKTGEDYSYFLDFVPDNCIRCSYGTSIGKGWTANQTIKIKQLLSKFKYISVREDVIAKELQNQLDKKCDVVCDPTMLLTKKEWMPFVSSKYKGKKFVVVYFNSEGGKNIEDAKKYAKKKGLDVYIVSTGFSFCLREKKVFPTKVEDFLSLLYYADTIFTASYHGMLFGLYFNKQLVYYNRHPTYRMETAAKKLGVECLEGTNLEIVDSLPLVNYAEVNAKLEKYRVYSTKKLSEALS